MAYEVVGLDEWAALSSPLTPLEEPWLEASFASKAYTPQPRGSSSDLIDIASGSATMSTASVTVLNLVTSTDLVDIASGSSTLLTFDRTITYEEYQERVVATAPFIYWPMDEGTGTTCYDHSGNGRNATGPGTQTSWISTDYSSMGPYALRYANTNSPQAMNWVGTVPLTGGYTFMATMRPPVRANYNHQISTNNSLSAGMWLNGSSAGTINVGQSNSATRSFVAPSVGPVANQWMTIIFSIGTDFVGHCYSVNNSTSFGQTHDLSVSLPAENGIGLYTGTWNSGGIDLQHVAIWDRVLTSEEMLSLVLVDVIAPTTAALASAVDLIDIDIPAVDCDTTVITGSATLESSADLADISTAAASLYSLIFSSTDIVDIDFDPVSFFFTIFVGIASSSDLADLSTANALLRRSVAPSAAGTTSTVTVTTVAAGTSERQTRISPEPMALELFTSTSIAKKGTAVIPRVPESVSDTDPSQASGIIIRALMGVSVQMDDPVIIDGRPT